MDNDAAVAPGPKRQSPIKIIIKYVVPLVFTVALCWLMFRDIDFGQMVDIIRQQCRFGWIALALCISILSHVARAARWQLQLDALDIRTPLFPLVLSIFGTYAVNLIFPRLGELWRTGYIAKRQDARFTTVFGSMVADRLADTVTVALLTVITFLLASATIGEYLAGGTAGFDNFLNTLMSPWLWIIVIAACAVLWVGYSRVKHTETVRKMRRAVANLWQGFAVVATMPHRGRWLLLTVAIWGCYFSQLWVAFYAFDFTAEVIHQHTILAVLVTFVMSSISMGVPSNGGIGPWQWAVILALGIYGVPQELSGAFANLVLGTQTLLLIVLGLFTFVCIALGKKTGKAIKAE